jgi:hypothetical protein
VKIEIMLENMLPMYARYKVRKKAVGKSFMQAGNDKNSETGRFLIKSCEYRL